MLRIILTVCFTIAATFASAIEIKQVTSEGGINAWVVEEPSIPFTALEIRMRGGRGTWAEASLASAVATGVTYSH